MKLIVFNLNIVYYDYNRNSNNIFKLYLLFDVTRYIDALYILQ